ncbi:MAG TPA: hypothetical protein VGQ85_10640, partial [Candidatus Limnocylindrales bacterium]|nr:hypothetical protein [Candidatus Limnocylindrales bacterium]
MSLTITHRIGSVESDPAGQRLQNLLAELARVPRGSQRVSWKVIHLAQSSSNVSTTNERDGKVSTPCSATTFAVSWGLDSSDDSIGFYDVPQAPVSCSADASGQDLALRRALEGVRTWLVDSPN